MTDSATPTPKLTFWQQITLYVEKLLHPEAKDALGRIASALATDKTALVAEAAASGQTIDAFLIAKLTALLAAEPEVAPFSEFIIGLFAPFIQKEIGYGVTDVGEVINKVVAWLIAEEANV